MPDIGGIPYEALIDGTINGTVSINDPHTKTTHVTSKGNICRVHRFHMLAVSMSAIARTPNSDGRAGGSQNP